MAEYDSLLDNFIRRWFIIDESPRSQPRTYGINYQRTAMVARAEIMGPPDLKNA